MQRLSHFNKIIVKLPHYFLPYGGDCWTEPFIVAMFSGPAAADVRLMFLFQCRCCLSKIQKRRINDFLSGLGAVTYKMNAEGLLSSYRQFTPFWINCSTQNVAIHLTKPRLSVKTASIELFNDKSTTFQLCPLLTASQIEELFLPHPVYVYFEI